MNEERIIELSDALTKCKGTAEEAFYVADTINQTFQILWKQNDRRKGEQFTHRMSVATGLVCSLLKDFVDDLTYVQNSVNSIYENNKGELVHEEKKKGHSSGFASICGN